MNRIFCFICICFFGAQLLFFSCKTTAQQPLTGLGPLKGDSSVTMPTYFLKGEKQVLVPSNENEYAIDSMLSKYVQSQLDPNAYDGCIFNYIVKYRVDTLGTVHDVVIVNSRSGEKTLDRQIKTAIEKLPLTPAREGSKVLSVDIISRIKLDWVTGLTFIEEIAKKMSRQDRLNDEDFLILEKYLMYAKDETFAEEVGYNMFNYLKKNEQHNEQFLNYLKKEGRPREDSIVQRMLQIMWIDIGEEYEEFNKCAHDFPLFKNYGVAKGSFSKLRDN